MAVFKREERYIVAKLRDVDEALTSGEKQLLQSLMQKVDVHRVNQGKRPLECVVVESDWPNYQSTWDSIEQAFQAKHACSEN